MIKKIKDMRNEDGFSLIELVVAVGILAILSVVGVVAYSKITENARKTAVEAAAAEVYTAAVAFDSDGNDGTDPMTVDTEWMDSSNGSIEVVVSKHPTTGDICATATMGEPHNITANKGAGCDGSTGTPGGGEEQETTPPVIASTVNINFSMNNPDMYGNVVGEIQGGQNTIEFSRVNNGTVEGNVLNFSITGQDSTLFNSGFSGDQGGMNDTYQIFYTIYDEEGNYLDENLVPLTCDVVSNDTESTAVYNCFGA